MGRDVNIFLSGGISNLTPEESSKWRSQIKDEILYGDYDYEYKPVFFNPTIYYDDNRPQKSELEVFEYNTNALRKSDLVIVNFNDPNSIGTAMELAIAHEHRIPVVCIVDEYGDWIHSWLKCCCTRVCNDIREVVKYVVAFYLN
jgi:hypothetical protein